MGPVAAAHGLGAAAHKHTRHVLPFCGVAFARVNRPRRLSAIRSVRGVGKLLIGEHDRPLGDLRHGRWAHSRYRHRQPRRIRWSSFSPADPQGQRCLTGLPAALKVALRADRSDAGAFVPTLGRSSPNDTGLRADSAIILARPALQLFRQRAEWDRAADSWRNHFLPGRGRA